MKLKIFGTLSACLWRLRWKFFIIPPLIQTYKFYYLFWLKSRFFLFSMWKLLAQLYNSKMRGKSMKITLDENFSFAAEKFCCVWTQIDRERARRMPQSETPNVYFGRMRVVDMSRVMRARVYFGENIEQNVKIWGRMSRK